MSNLPEPLTPVDCDLRDFTYMPLDVVRLRDSTAASLEGESFRAAVLSWCVAWHQTPAASLQDNDIVLCRLLGYGRDVKGWMKVRAAGALHGWIKCSDGRLYHPVVAEKAIEAWEQKVSRKQRTEAARETIKKQKLQQQAKTAVTDSVTESVTDQSQESVTGSKGEERNREERKGVEQTLGQPRLTDGQIATEFFHRQFWPAYPRKLAKGEALKAFLGAWKRASPEQILGGLKIYPFSAEPTKRPHAATWLNGSRWEIEADTAPPTVIVPPQKSGGARLTVTESLAVARGNLAPQNREISGHVFEAPTVDQQGNLLS